MRIMNEIIKDIEELRNNRAGEKHGYFTIGGYPSNDWLGIDTLDICKALAPYEVDYEVNDGDELPDEKDMYGFGNDYATRYIDYLISLGYIQDWNNAECNNTYNWSSPVTNDIDYTIFNSLIDNSVYVMLKVHRFGDVRCNYTDSCILKFDNKYEWFDAFDEVCRTEYVTIDDVEYAIEINFWTDVVNVYTADNWDCLFDIYDLYRDDAIKIIKYKLANSNETK